MPTLSKRPHPLRVLMISSEVESLARTGGLGDVVDALSVALAEIGADVLVVTPLYGVTRVPPNTTRWPAQVDARWGWGPHDVRALGVVELEPMRFPSGGSRRVCLLDDPPLYQRAGIYSDPHGTFGDNELRFAVMSRGGLEVASKVWPDGGPDVLHAHDWHATFAILYARLVMGEAWSRVPAVFTVHNLQFQGVLDEGALDRLHLPRAIYRPEILWHEGHVNLMKGATALADRITTVSPTYAHEILSPHAGFGLDLHLRAHAHKLVGIVNGIDTTRWDPRTDTVIAARYDENSAKTERVKCKRALLEELGLDASDESIHRAPLFGVVSRLTWQKGIDLLLPLLSKITDLGANVVVVGQGDRHLEDHLMFAASLRPKKIAARIAFDPALSRRVYAGSDFFVVPSRFEPCGLTQMYAMRYGALPIVTDVGGLHDTIEPLVFGEGIPVATESGNGFLASDVSVDAIFAAFERALALFADENGALERAVFRAMKRAAGFAWAGSAYKYLALYEDLFKERAHS